MESSELNQQLNSHRFIRYPQDHEIIETGSTEGMFHGSLPSEVLARNTQQLESAGCTWEQGVTVFKYLMAAMAWRSEQFANALKDVTWGVSYEENQRITQKIESKIPLPGFSGAITKCKFHGARFEHSALIVGQAIIPEDIFDDEENFWFDNLVYYHLVANPEIILTIELPDGRHIETTQNRQTLLLLEVNHILQQGNRYAMDGEVLAHLILNFDEQEFFNLTGAWLDEMRDKYEGVIGNTIRTMRI